MKTYDEMTQSVLRRAAAGIAARDRRRKTILSITATGLCLALVLAAVGLFRNALAGITDSTQPTISMETPTQPTISKETPTQPTISMETPTTEPDTQPESTEPVAAPTEMTVYFLSGNASHVSQKYLLEGVSIPIDGKIRVRRFNGLSEEERNQAILEEEAIEDAYRAEYSTAYSGVNGSTYIGYNAMITCMINGSVSLEFADKDHVSSVELENNWTNGVASGSMCYTKEATYGEGDNQVTFPVGSMRYLVFWSIPHEMEQQLLNDPSMPLSAVSDTITITVNYSNGAQQTLIIDVTVDDEGQVYMTQRGNNTGV